MENKYIEAFKNIIFQKRDNGYISDAYRNDIDVVYEALNKLEKLKVLEIMEKKFSIEVYQSNEQTYKMWVVPFKSGYDEMATCKLTQEEYDLIKKSLV